MKKYILKLFILLLVYSCGDDVQFNSPAFQGDKENELWRASAFSAAINESGELTIIGTNNFETVKLIVPTAVEGNFQLGVVNAVEAIYEGPNNTFLSTNNTPDESVSLYPEIGEMQIESIDVVNETFTGTFRFLAFDESGTNSIGFTNGIFFKVPLVEGSLPTNPLTCEETETNAETARLNYEATFSPDLDFINREDFESACSAYSNALSLQRNFCGDPDGSILALIENLEGCEMPCEFAENNTTEAALQFNTSTLGTYLESCQQYQVYLNQQIEICGDPDGSLQAELAALDCTDDDNDGVPNVYEDFNGDGDLENDDIDNDGVPNYLDDDDDGDGVLTADEAKDANGNPLDTDDDGDVDYLDDDDDGDGILSNFETGDTDGDGTPDYLDPDDDGDGILTANESPDPNGDGNPDDAVDTDADGVPNYLQA